MRISNQTPTYQPTAGAQRTSFGAGSFGKQLDIAVSRHADQLEVSAEGAAWRNADEMDSSPYLMLLESYAAWNAQQPPQDLPDSWGPTEENLAYLKGHYTGDLSWEERVDALKTMEQLGVITKEQRYDAMGSTAVVASLDEIIEHTSTHVLKQYNAYLSGGWNACFQDHAIGTFQTADDLFAWLDKLLESDA